MQLDQDEHIIRQERLHAAVFFQPSLFLAGLLLLSTPVLFLLYSLPRALGVDPGFRPLLVLVPDLFLGLGAFLVTTLAYLNSEVILTNKRLLYRTGFIVRRSGQVPLRNVEGIHIFEPLLGRLCNYGTVTVTTVGGVHYPMHFIGKCQILQALLQKTVAAATQSTTAPTPSAPPPQDDARYMPRPWRPEPAPSPRPNRSANPFAEASPSAQGSELLPVTDTRKSMFALIALGTTVVLAIAFPLVMLFLWPAVHFPSPARSSVSAAFPTPPHITPVAIPVPTSAPTPTPGPSVEDIKRLAEQGDPRAQDRLGDIYRQSGNWETAVLWYRKAAPHGIVNSQYYLSKLLLGWANTWSTKPDVAAQHCDEAIPWLVKAANQGHKNAQLDLGGLYRDGKLLSKNVPEAYKWFSLVAQSTEPFDGMAINGRMFRDRLVLTMTPAEIAEGNRLLAAFSPNTGESLPPPEPAYVSLVKLQGITGVPSRALAIINGKTFAAGESGCVKVGPRSVMLQCLAITPTSATVTIDNAPTPKQLHLR